MPVGIAEIDAYAAALPLGAPLDVDAVGSEPRLPPCKLLAADRERDMQRAVTVVGRDGTARHVHGVEREAAPEDEQHALAADVIGAEPGVTDKLLQSQYVAVEARRALEVVDVQGSLEHAVKLRHDSRLSRFGADHCALSPLWERHDDAATHSNG